LVFTDDPDRGSNIHIRLQLKFERQGLYWIDALANDELLTRLPLRILYQLRTMNSPVVAVLQPEHSPTQ